MTSQSLKRESASPNPISRSSSMDLRYPIGSFKLDGTPTGEQVKQAINEIAEAPAQLRAAVENLTPEQIETPYRPDGWTVRQVVHHVPDSHLNSYCRFKLALTEDNPRIKPYDEAAWAKLADTERTPVETSLALLDSLHQRWVTLLESMKPEEFARTLQ